MGIERAPRITLTPEQQTRVNQLIDQAYGKGYNKGKAEVEGKAQDEAARLRARIAELESKKSIFPWRRNK